MLPKDNTVYIIERQDTGVPIYVGITRGSLLDRLASHRSKGTPVGQFITDTGTRVSILPVKAGLTRGQAIDEEATLIMSYGIDNLLNTAVIGSNITEAGGSGYSSRLRQEGKRFPGMSRRPNIDWPEEIFEEMAHVTDMDLSRKYGINENTIRTKRLRMGIKKATAKAPTVWTDDMDATIGTMSDVQAGKQLGVGTMSVRGRRKRLGIPAFKPPEHVVRCRSCGTTIPRSFRPCGARMSIAEHKKRKYCSPECYDLKRSQ